MYGDDPESGAAGEGARAPGLRASLARVAAAGVGLLSTRAELFSLELAEERGRLTQVVGLVAAAGLLLAFAALFVGAWIVVYFWDSHRLWAIALVALAFLGLGLLLLSQARAAGRSAPAPFTASLDELRKDRALLERSLAQRRD